jgi:hypothetical protein
MFRRARRGDWLWGQPDEISAVPDYSGRRFSFAGSSCHRRTQEAVEFAEPHADAPVAEPNDFKPIRFPHFPNCVFVNAEDLGRLLHGDDAILADID